jgi:hypothetical protein
VLVAVAGLQVDAAFLAVEALGVVVDISLGCQRHGDQPGGDGAVALAAVLWLWRESARQEGETEEIVVER